MEYRLAPFTKKKNSKLDAKVYSISESFELSCTHAHVLLLVIITTVLTIFTVYNFPSNVKHLFLFITGDIWVTKEQLDQMQRSLAHYSREGIRWIGIPLPERLRHAKEDSWESQMRCDLDEVTIMNFPALVYARDNMWTKNSIQRLITDWLTAKMNQCSN
jgi:hypothetical protein